MSISNASGFWWNVHDIRDTFIKFTIPGDVCFSHLLVSPAKIIDKRHLVVKKQRFCEILVMFNLQTEARTGVIYGLL